MQRLRVDDSRRFLVREDGSPFFYLRDTAWQMVRQLDREEVEHYLKNRAAKRFTVIQTVLLAEFRGAGGTNAYGQSLFAARWADLTLAGEWA